MFKPMIQPHVPPDNIPPEFAWPLIIVLWSFLAFMIYKEHKSRK